MAINYLNTNLNAEDDFCNGSCSCESNPCAGEAPVPEASIRIVTHDGNSVGITGGEAVNALYDFLHKRPVQISGVIIPYEAIDYVEQGTSSVGYTTLFNGPAPVNEFQGVLYAAGDISTPLKLGDKVRVTVNGGEPSEFLLYWNNETDSGLFNKNATPKFSVLGDGHIFGVEVPSGTTSANVKVEVAHVLTNVIRMNEELNFTDEDGDVLTRLVVNLDDVTQYNFIGIQIDDQPVVYLNKMPSLTPLYLGTGISMEMDIGSYRLTVQDLEIGYHRVRIYIASEDPGVNYIKWTYENQSIITSVATGDMPTVPAEFSEAESWEPTIVIAMSDADYVGGGGK